MMNRREAIARIVAATGGAFVGAELLMTGCSRADKRRTTAFAASDVALLDEIADTIIPTTDTPGAKAAGVGAFMAQMVNDVYDDDTHLAFEDGLVLVNEACRKKTGKPFMEATPAERASVLTAIDREAREHERTKGRDERPHYFRLMRELTVLGYFSSEIGCTQALRYVETPGAYRGDEPYAKGERQWFNPSRRLG
jgi:hypothetical protein